MNQTELIARLTALVQEQADIIRIQADALVQLGEVAGMEERMEKAAREREKVIGE